MSDTYAVIMAGGVGSRFWPMSTKKFPKQFHDILGTGRTLIQMTYDRLKNLVPISNIYIVTNEIYKDLVLEQLDGIESNQVLLEPLMRNTAPCIAYAAYKIQAINPNASLIVAPSDHLISNEIEFVANIKTALETAIAEKSLITLGIKPSRPDTGYGYIQHHNSKTAKNPSIKKVKTFTEKPNLELAKEFVNSGDFLWNSGIFIWTVEAIIQSFKLYLPELDEIFDEGKKYYHGPDEDIFISKAYPTCPLESIDYGIMEKAKNVYVLAVNFGWSDLGTWGSLYTHVDHDKHENASVEKNTYFYNSSKNIVNIEKGKVAVIQGLEDYIVVDRNNVLLICKKSEEQRIKDFVKDIKINEGEDYS